jgi:hypothetical protein
MTNAEQNDDWTAYLRKLIASVRSFEHRFKNAAETIRKYRPDEETGDFPSLEGIETMGSSTLVVLDVTSELAVKVAERRADELLTEAEDVERVRAENLRRQNMSPLEAKVERLERAVAYQGAEIAKLKGIQTGRLPALPHVARSEVPQFLGMPGGMGRHAVVGAPGGSGGVRKLGTSAAVPASDTSDQSGFTRREHPLNIIGGGGKR